MPGRDDQRVDDVYEVDTRTRGGSRVSSQRQASDGHDHGTNADRGRGRGWRWRWVLAVIAILVVAWLAFMVWVPFHAWGNVQRINVSPVGTRPMASKGYDYLLVGSDSREGLTRAQQKQLSTGSTKVAQGTRTDSIILVHVPSDGGPAALISLPRDSYVPIPGHGHNKINAAYALGGPKLLVQTIEQVTDLRIDGYVEIGFGGFATVVDSLDGVDICVKRAMDDPKAGINLKAGCQTLNGPNALGYVRARYSDPLGDIGRVERQRQFLGAIMHKAASPSTVLIPWRYYRFATSAGAGLTVGDDTSLRDVTRVLMAMRSVSGGEGLSLTVPISNPALPTHVGSAVKWDSQKALELFTKIKNDEPLTVVPTGSAK
ncbi:MAG: LCP family protein [Phycicoccus sp.]|nr:LCP family protein [Phycicoccus sp.]NMM32686.1 LCP family protein [Phycicoccus sp.]